MCLFIYSISLSIIFSIKKRLNSLKGSCVSTFGGRFGEPWLSQSLIWRGSNSGSGQGLGGAVFAVLFGGTLY